MLTKLYNTNGSSIHVGCALSIDEKLLRKFGKRVKQHTIGGRSTALDNGLGEVKLNWSGLRT